MTGYHDPLGVRVPDVDESAKVAGGDEPAVGPQDEEVLEVAPVACVQEALEAPSLLARRGGGGQGRRGRGCQRRGRGRARGEQGALQVVKKSILPFSRKKLFIEVNQCATETED